MRRSWDCNDHDNRRLSGGVVPELHHRLDVRMLQIGPVGVIDDESPEWNGAFCPNHVGYDLSSRISRTQEALNMGQFCVHLGFHT